jgi:hypothetical protein
MSEFVKSITTHPRQGDPMRRNIRWTRGLAATVASLAVIAGVGAGAGAGTTEPPAATGPGERLVVGNS